MGKVKFSHSEDIPRMNRALLIDLQRAADDCGYNITITTAITGHSYKTKGGKRSRHNDGVAVDISIINDVSYNSNRSLFTAYGHRLCASFESMNYTRNSENGNTKAVLWYFNSKSAGNHYNHLHVSNKSNFSSIIGSKKPSSKNYADENSIISSSKNNDDGYHSDEDSFQENVSETIENVNELAKGVWQIVKFVIDPALENRQINDLSLSHFQGSLFNFVKQICQEPFVEFWGDTYGDQYYFIARVPPFTKDLYKTLPTIVIEDRDVLSDSLDFCNEAYSWYQLTPSANYIGISEYLNSYLPAVFFPEYAEIWGSKPLSVINQYITYVKETGEIQKDKAIDDLKFLINIHSYMPFTRQGSITINGDRRIKKGMRIYYAPTNEYFYVDGVNNNLQVSDGVIDRITTLNVSRGMIADFVDNEIEDDLTPNYFNLIKFEKEKKIKNRNKEDKKEYKDINATLKHQVALFNFNKSTFDYSDATDFVPNTKTFFNSAEAERNIHDADGDDEMKLTRAEVMENFSNIEEIISVADTYKNVRFDIVGYTDDEGTNQYNNVLGLNRAKTVFAILNERYRRRHEFTRDNDDNKIPNDNVDQLVQEFSSRFNIKTLGKTKPRTTNETKYGRKQNRRVEIFVENMSEEKAENNPTNQSSNVTAAENGNWRVNKDVFLFFLRRQQFVAQIRNTSKIGSLKPVVVESKVKNKLNTTIKKK